MHIKVTDHALKETLSDWLVDSGKHKCRWILSQVAKSRWAPDLVGFFIRSVRQHHRLPPSALRNHL